MKTQADSKRRELSFEAGDIVFLRIQPYRQHSLAKRKYQKLTPLFFGPYKILRRVGPVAYELDLPATSKVHPIFHVSLLRPARGQNPDSPPAPLPINSDWELTLSPGKVLAHRWVKRGVPTLELLIQWEGRPLEESSWESYDLLASQFPTFRLEDKATFKGGCTDTVPPLQTYSRRKWRKTRGGDRSLFIDHVQHDELMGLLVQPLEELI